MDLHATQQLQIRNRSYTVRLGGFDPSGRPVYDVRGRRAARYQTRRSRLYPHRLFLVRPGDETVAPLFEGLEFEECPAGLVLITRAAKWPRGPLPKSL